MSNHPYGKDEMNADNNHGTCWVMQAAVFARYVGDGDMMNFCRNRFKNILLPNQMSEMVAFHVNLLVRSHMDILYLIWMQWQQFAKHFLVKQIIFGVIR